MTASAKTVLVTGAAGGTGRAISRFLADRGFRVKGLVRPEDDINGLAIGRENLVTGYIEDPQAVYTAMQGVNAVINCAALLPKDLDLPQEAFHRVNVLGPLNILNRLPALKSGTPFFFSTIHVVDHNTKKITRARIREYVENPPDAYLRSKINLEKELTREAKTFDGRISIIRPAFIYGPGNYAVWQDALRLVKNEKMFLIGSGNVHLPLTYSQDVARFILILLNRSIENTGVDIYVLANQQPASMNQVFSFIADNLGVKRPGHLPAWPLSLAAAMVGFLPGNLRVGRLKLLTKARVRQYSKGYDLSGLIDPPPLGFAAQTKFEEGLTQMLEEYKMDHHL